VTTSPQNVFAVAPAYQGRQGPHLLVAGGDRTHCRWSAAKGHSVNRGELNSSARARWGKTIEVFNDEGEAQQLKFFLRTSNRPADDPQVARVLLNRVRLERTRQFGACYLGLELWSVCSWDRFFESTVDAHDADVLGPALPPCWRSTACVTR